MPTPIAAWYPDPHEPSRLRWWDGTSWTNWCRDHTPGADGRASAAAEPEPPPEAISEPRAPFPPDQGPEPEAQPRSPDSLLGPAEWPSIAPESHRVEPPWASTWTDGPELAAEVAPEPAPEPAPVSMAAPPLEQLAPESIPPPVPESAPGPAPTFESVEEEGPERRLPAEVPAGAASLGSSLLPPLEIPTQSFAAPPPMEAPAAMPSGRGGAGGPLRAILIVLVIVAMCGLGFGLYSRGTLDGLIGSAREASNEGVTVYSGDGYSIEVPNDWTQGSTPTEGAVAFVAPTEDVVQITSPAAESDAEIDVSDPAARTMVFDVLIRIMQAVKPDMRVLTRASTSVAGAPGEKLTVTGTDPVTGQPLQSTAYLFVNDGRFYVVELMSDISGADAGITAEFEKLVASFRFD